LEWKPAVWRLVRSAPGCGAWNMAVDEAILEAVGRGEVPATLRLYAWNPACLSIGYAQHFQDADLAALEEFDWELVRRPTGGRAILHTDELTYAVIGSNREPVLAGSVLESYRRLSLALLGALDHLGLGATADDTYTLSDTLSAGRPVCFEAPSNYEITVGGKKLIGSAQARRKDGVLQHGSLPLRGDLTRITRALSFESEKDRAEAAKSLLEHASTLEICLGKAVTWEEATQAFEAGFCKALNLSFMPSDLTAQELERAQQLVVEKYAHRHWLERV
jgi:lipoyl(octanoyl) transferase